MKPEFKNGQRVWWNDPAGETSGYYTIVGDVRRDVEELEKQGGTEGDMQNDLIILLSGESGGETQVHTHEIEPVYEGTCDDLCKRENELWRDMQNFILNRLRQSGGHISLKMPETEDEEKAFEYPVTSALLGRDGYDIVDITDIYAAQNASVIYADGRVGGFMERGYRVSAENLSDVLRFIRYVSDNK